MKRGQFFLTVIAVSTLSLMSFLTHSPTEDLQIFKTSLKIAIINELGNFEAGTKVTLYESDDDYRNEENPATPTLTTDKKGKVTFKDLKSKVYFIHAVKGDKNNDAAGVQTDKLLEGKLNKVNIIIE